MGVPLQVIPSCLAARVPAPVSGRAPCGATPGTCAVAGALEVDGADADLGKVDVGCAAGVDAVLVVVAVAPPAACLPVVAALEAEPGCGGGAAVLVVVVGAVEAVLGAVVGVAALVVTTAAGAA